MRPSLAVRRHPTPGAVRSLPCSGVSDAKPFSTPLLKTLLTKPRQSTHRGFQTKPSFEEGVNQAATIDPLTVTEVPEKTEETFDWWKNWYPLQAIFNLYEDRPNRVQLLDKWFVVWKGKHGEWVVMDDRCPHRFAPLSEGRIEKDDGNLLCSYHAWRFDETGKCVRIPHAEPGKAHDTACNSSRSRVHTYPSKSRGGLLWVWPDTSPTAKEDCKKGSICMEDSLADHCEEKTIDGDQWYTRVLPYNYDCLMENLLDPSHFIVSHHKTFPGLNRYKAKPLRMKQCKPLSDEAYVAYEHEAVVPLHKYGLVEFRAPVTVILHNSDYREDEKWVRQHAMITPLTKHKCRAFMYNHTAGMLAGEKGYVKSSVLFQLPAWQMHAVYNNIVDGDIIFINIQDQMLRRTGTEFESAKSFYIPSTSDSMVMAFRKWFETAGRTGEVWGNATAYDESHELYLETYLDRYTSHVLHCRACQNALARFQFAAKALKWIAVAAAATAVCLVVGMFNGSPIHWKNVVTNRKVLIALGVAGFLTVIRHLVEKFTYKTFFFHHRNHPDNN